MRDRLAVDLARAPRGVRDRGARSPTRRPTSGSTRRRCSAAGRSWRSRPPRRSCIARACSPRATSRARTSSLAPLDPGADRLERAVYDTVRAEPGISTFGLRAALLDSDPIRWLSSELQDVGLLIAPDAARRLRWLWLWGAGLALAGALLVVAALDAGAVAGYLTAAVAAVVLATVHVARRGSPVATARGVQIVRARRAEREDLARSPQAAESATATALFGGGALWLADPALASTLDVPREAGPLWRRHGGGCGSGGGCGWGASYLGDGGGHFGGGHDGGGGCGGGGGGGCGGGGG